MILHIQYIEREGGRNRKKERQRTDKQMEKLIMVILKRERGRERKEERQREDKQMEKEIETF